MPATAILASSAITPTTPMVEACGTLPSTKLPIATTRMSTPNRPMVSALASDARARITTPRPSTNRLTP
jgi:hypothetical protein